MIHIIYEITESPFCENPDLRSYLTPLIGFRSCDKNFQVRVSFHKFETFSFQNNHKLYVLIYFLRKSLPASLPIPRNRFRREREEGL